MYFEKYLLSIEGFTDEEKGEALMRRAFSHLDDARRQKAERMRRGRPQAACTGAGLLLQLAVREALRGRSGDFGEGGMRRYSALQLLEALEGASPIPLEYEYGKRGKPYLKNFPYYFNLSHSGDYVVCALSDAEVGADIQQHRGGSREKVAERFFSEGEIRALEASGEKEELFFRLWARKEACGKLTGEGVAGVLGLDLSRRDMELPGGRRLVWEEYDDVPGYSIAFCRYIFYYTKRKFVL